VPRAWLTVLSALAGGNLKEEVAPTVSCPRRGVGQEAVADHERHIEFECFLRG